MTTDSISPEVPRRAWPSPAIAGLLSTSLVVAVLYCARVVLVPIALAILLAFLLAPVVNGLDRAGLSRTPAVLVTLASVALLVAGIVWFLAIQLNAFLNEVPNYQENMRAKVRMLRVQGNGGTLQKVRKAVEDLARERDALPPPPPGRGGKKSIAAGTPMLVKIADETGSDRLFADAAQSFAAVKPALGTFADSALSLVLAIFMLIRREDLRNRLVSFASTRGLATTTKALDEAGQRISRYLRVQLIVNSTFGLIIAVGLFALHVPYALLWGFCAAVLRYVPYLGTWIAASMPLAVSFIAFPGWGECLKVFALFLVLDVVTANAIEPKLYGQGIGVSEVALLVSAAFWAWLWGPVGLILAAPLTVGVVVMSKYVPSFSFLDRLLGDSPGLEPSAAFLQRLLARDGREAAIIVAKYQEENPRESVYDGLILPALSRVRVDRTAEVMTARDETFAIGETNLILGKLAIEPPPDPNARLERILGCPARLEVEESALFMLDQLGRSHGFQVETLSRKTLSSEVIARVERERPRVVVVSVMPPDGIPQTEYLCSTLRKVDPRLGIVVGYWGHKIDLDEIIRTLRSAGASYVTTTLVGARQHVSSMLETPISTILPIPETAANALSAR